MANQLQLGVVTDGAFNQGLVVRLDADTSTEGLRIGSFVVIEGERHRFFGLIADISLKSADPRVAADPPRDASGFIRRVLAGTTTYATVEVKPQLMLDLSKGDEERMMEPVRTIPMHFAVLRDATQMDFHTVFGEPDATHFEMGSPLTMDIPICLNLERWTQRSNGIFGQSGTGKSFLARLILCGVIKSQVAVNLIFDMHDEYAFGKESEDHVFVKGLRDLFGPQVVVYSLDAAGARRAGRSVDVVLQIGLNQIEPADVLLLAEELDLTSTAAASIGLLEDHFRQDWLVRLLAMSPDEVSEFCAKSGANEASVGALQRKLKLVARRGYITPEAEYSPIDDMVANFAAGRHVVLQFGQYTDILDYMLVANIITRRIHKDYVEQMAKFEQTHDPAQRPRQLMITIEEAHKFLNPAVARQTIFGTIARELRKYSVTLMVVDQRPSGIDAEIMSQLGTRVTGRLTEERDIESALTGVGGRHYLRSALESLDTRQQVLLIGHAVPMPIVIRTRPYDEAFYQAVGYKTGAQRKAQLTQDVVDLWGGPRKQ
ncbi:MAG: ATP-binding protein [Chloroflexi bacterium]|nr:ATP-binding protein [Chloroflexota bacterium]